MRRLVLVLAVVALVSCSGGRTSASPAASTATTAGGSTATGLGAAGYWKGTISGSIGFDARLSGDGSGTVDIPVQGASALTVTGARLDGSTLSFTLPQVRKGSTFTGVLDATGTVTGTLTQGDGPQLRFTMARGALHPQEPLPPFAYRSEDVRLPSGSIMLAGTLTEPQGAGPFPAVVLLTGSGAQDRDETVAGHRGFLVLADAMTRAGFAVLRTDDRGVGGSGGDLASATYDDLAGDALAGVAWLRGRPDVDKGHVGLFGHSEGGYLAPLAASRSGGQVHFVVLMAGPSVPGSDVLLEQNRRILGAAGAAPQEVDAQITFVTELVRLLGAGQRSQAADLIRTRLTVQNQRLPAAQQQPAAAIDAQAEAMTSTSFAAFLAYDPAPALRSLTVPVLAFFGERDLQVPATQNEGPMRNELAGTAATVTTLPGLNHLMQPAVTGAPTEYAGIDTTVDPSALDLVTSWLGQHAR